MEGYLLTIDIEKAFDAVDHYFLLAILETWLYRKLSKMNRTLLNCHLYMNSVNSDCFFFHINYDPPREYQFLNDDDYVTRLYKGVVLDKWLN